MGLGLFFLLSASGANTFLRRCLLRGVNLFLATITICTGPMPPINFVWSLYEKTRRFVEKTVKITSGSSILIRQHCILIYNFDVRFVEICLVFLKIGWENVK